MGKLSPAPAICRRGFRADEEPTRRFGRRALVAIVLVVVFAFAVSTAQAVTRPNPVIELRKAMSRRFYGENTIRWAALAPIVCRRLAAKPGQQFRYLCTFKNFAEEGTARVELGTPPAWKTTVTITRLVCLKEPDRKGCP